jgi:hypothetical protein
MKSPFKMLFVKFREKAKYQVGFLQGSGQNQEHLEELWNLQLLVKILHLHKCNQSASQYFFHEP